MQRGDVHGCRFRQFFNRELLCVILPEQINDTRNVMIVTPIASRFKIELHQEGERGLFESSIYALRDG